MVMFCVSTATIGVVELFTKNPTAMNSLGSSPGFVAYATLAKICGATAITYALEPPDWQIDVDALRGLALAFKRFYAFPDDPRDQLRGAIRAVFESWMGARGDVLAHPPHP